MSLGFAKENISVEFEPVDNQSTEISLALTQNNKKLQILAGNIQLPMSETLSKWNDWLIFASKKFVSVKKFRTEMYKTLATFKSVNSLVETLDKNGFTINV